MSDVPERQPSTAPRPCAHCGRQFTPDSPKSMYCSALCRRKANQARRPARKHGGPSTVDISLSRKEG